MIWFIATVWVWNDGDEHEGVPTVLRLQAADEDDYRQRVRRYADDVKGRASHVTIGPVSESKVQG
ncbi:MAG: hypothetical protein ABJA98_01555 [Acidobacteriota bacterium]